MKRTLFNLTKQDQMQIFKKFLLCPATNITHKKTTIETDLSASLEGVYQLECVHETCEHKPSINNN